jgi:NAD-dependent SIR2 family protein deacetylase
MYVYCSDCDQQIHEDLLERNEDGEDICPNCGNPYLYEIKSIAEMSHDVD